jgi:hypothetical protein
MDRRIIARTLPRQVPRVTPRESILGGAAGTGPDQLLTTTEGRPPANDRVVAMTSVRAPTVTSKLQGNEIEKIYKCRPWPEDRLNLTVTPPSAFQMAIGKVLSALLPTVYVMPVQADMRESLGLETVTSLYELRRLMN